MILLRNHLYVLFINIFPALALAEEGKGGMPQLDPSSYTSQIFWLILSFISLFCIINFYFLPRIFSVKISRENLVNNYIKEAQEMNNNAEKIKKELDKDLSIAKSKVSEIIKITIDKNKKFSDEKFKKLKVSLENDSKNLINNLENEKAKILNNIEEYSYEISNKIFNKLLNEEKQFSLNEFKKLTKKEN